jgi:alpha-galactosidase
MNLEENDDNEADNLIEAHFTPADIAASDLDHEAWNAAQVVAIKRYWSGEDAPVGRHAEARLLWSNEALCARFICRQTEPLVVNNHPLTKRKTMGLWDRDVCELFIAPDAREPERYFEFEAAPTGEWLDLLIHHKLDERETDWEFHSGMTAAARVTAGRITIAMRIPWGALGVVPQPGDEWRANLFRCVGTGRTRGYLAWRPTRTEEPGFHVPAAFGWIRFVKQESEAGIKIKAVSALSF